MHDQLVSYLLGELDEEECRLVEARLREDPNLRCQLAHLQECLNSGDCDEHELPPEGLAQRTSQTVAYVADSGEFDQVDGCTFSSLGFAQESSETTGSGRCQWSIADMTVAAGVVLAVGMLLLPALRDSRMAARRLQCQDNLYKVGLALAHYSSTFNGELPHVQPGGNAGQFAVRLVQSRSIDRDEMSRLVVCPSSPMADEVRSRRLIIRIPTSDELRRAQGLQLVQLKRTMGGSIAYRLPYVQHGRLVMIRNRYQSHVPIMADGPLVQNAHSKKDYTSCNHGGCGQNVLFLDQSVRYVTGYVACHGGNDHLFLNHRGRPVPGALPNDTVLVRSEAELSRFAMD